MVFDTIVERSNWKSATYKEQNYIQCVGLNLIVGDHGFFTSFSLSQNRTRLRLPRRGYATILRGLSNGRFSFLVSARRIRFLPRFFMQPVSMGTANKRFRPFSTRLSFFFLKRFAIFEHSRALEGLLRLVSGLLSLSHRFWRIPLEFGAAPRASSFLSEIYPPDKRMSLLLSSSF